MRLQAVASGTSPGDPIADSERLTGTRSTSPRSPVPNILAAALLPLPAPIRPDETTAVYPERSRHVPSGRGLLQMD